MDSSSHLSVILDLSPTQWHLSSLPDSAQPLSFRSFLTQALAFLNSHLALKHENTLAVYGALPGKSILLYSTPEQKAELAEENLADANTYLPFKLVDNIVTRQIGAELDLLKEEEEELPCQLVGALTKALCHINRLVNPATISTNTDTPSIIPLEPRILILSVSPDVSSSYIPLMNSIFSAQKLKVTIDVCKIFGPDTVFLQQAAHLTGGSYVYLEQRDALLQHLLMTFLPPPSMRRILAVPTQDKIDFRAACFCHKNIVDIGFVCSVCLSIFCQPIPVCSTCRTKFPIKSLQRLNASRPTPPSSGARTPIASPASRAGLATGPSLSSSLNSMTLNNGFAQGARAGPRPISGVATPLGTNIPATGSTNTLPGVPTASATSQHMNGSGPKP